MPTNTVHLGTLGHVRTKLNLVVPEAVFVELDLACVAGPVDPALLGFLTYLQVPPA